MFEPLAIVGRSCILPGADSPEALWDAVVAGRDLISSAPADRWGLDPDLALTADPKRSDDRAWSDRGGYVSGFDFRSELTRDPFLRDGDDLLRLDPLFQWVLSAGRKALREAGHFGTSDRVGAFVGNLSFPSSSMSRYAEHVWFGRPAVDPRNRFMSGLPALLLAEQLGLAGGALALDAACASSLYAIALAAQRLQSRELDLALAGAVCRSDDLFIHVGFCALDAMSLTGRSRPFHRDADGLVPAEGAAFVALKRLDDAVRAGDRIHGVIRGIGLSNDGRGRGLLAPSSEGQARALRAAWAGLDPSRLGLVECHATGTPVGDAAEVHTMREVFGDRVRDLPIGSLKSNMGHLVTAAGAAALLKVLGAFANGTRPPTLHADPPNPALAGTPFRLLHRAEPWPSSGPRLAGISAFGFGGNNAHVVVEEWDGSSKPATVSAPTKRSEVAVVRMAVRAAGVRSAADWVADLQAGGRHVKHGRAVAAPVVLPLEKLKFPPRDLQQTLPQQLLVLEATFEALEGTSLPRERTAVLVGSQADAEVCRYGARWRMSGWHRGEDVAAARDAVTPVLQSAGVVGTMPNIPANRVGSQFDLAGPAFTVSAEELSGMEALRIACGWLRTGAVDAAVVGAVDLSAELVHETAQRAVIGARPAGDAAVALVLMRAEDARAQGMSVLALLDDPWGDEAVVLGDGGLDLGARLGVAHAAHGLVHVAAAIAAVAYGVRPTDGAGAAWSDGARAARVVGRSMTGSTATVGVRSAGPVLPRPAAPQPAGRPLELPSHLPEIAPPRRTVSASTGSSNVDMPLAPKLPPVGARKPVPEPAPQSSTMPQPPSPTTPRPPAPHVPVPVPVPVPDSAPLGATAFVGSPPPDVLVNMAALHQQLGAAHQTYLDRQRAVHDQFLALRQRSTQLLLDAARGRVVIDAPPPTPVVAAVVAPPPVVVTPPPAPKPAVVAAPAPISGTGTGTGTGTLVRRFAARDAKPGPKWGRAELESLASDKISKVFGPLFARQDDFRRQVRMPEPPLLLADRVTGLDAEPGAMTTGVIWTETDITWDSWYLHDGTMPAGVMIEAGQADLLLISWLGADFSNRGERVYRLLGCTLTYSGGLPRPGETVHYEIHVDGHANLGATRIFFFHYDCVDGDDQPRLVVRNGQAGFFSDAELAESGGILWTPETGEHAADARVDPPVVKDIARTYTHEQVLAFAHGDGHACFGAGYERLATHTRTPRIAPPPMSFWQRVTELDPKGGPWKRGYLRAEQDITPDDWFFQGHFKDDPCMPGTMMFEACLQAVGFYMAALGFTLRKDGWTFEPVPDIPYDLKCRGQVIPSSKFLVYEVFVEEVHDGPQPTVYADFLCTIDGLKAFHARRVGVRLRPDYPITSRPDLQDLQDSRPVATVDGFPFGYASLLACAWGLPSEAFGPMYTPFDQGRHCARLPGPPYHFMTRLTQIDGPIGGMKIGTSIVLEYDIPRNEWYFQENGYPTMPFCVLLEAALQPCGWIACFVGSALTTDQDLFFRNLDGTATWHRDLLPTDGMLTTRAKITNISKSAGMIIQGFEVTCLVGDEVVFEMKTVFGFFPRAALANQLGMPPSAEERAALHAPSDFRVDLTDRPAKYFATAPRLADRKLMMLDRVTGLWPTGGKKGLGRIRSEKDVNPREWFFKAHFFGDPVQPGSLGLEALVQLLQFWMIETGQATGMKNPRFEPLMMGRAHTWKYRGQVIPENKVIRGELDIVEIGRDEKGVFAVADGYLWVDDLRIYQAISLGMRIVEGDGDPEPLSAPIPETEVVLDPAKDPWLADHPPTYTLPALPAMSMVDRLAGAAVRPGEVVREVRDVTVHRWVVLDKPVRSRAVAGERRGDEVSVRFEVWRDAPDPRLSRFELAAEGTVVVGRAHDPAPAPLPELDAPAVPDPYAAGSLFHGPAFQYLTALRRDGRGSSARLDASKGAVPRGTLHQGLLDALTHAIPHDDLGQWAPAIGAQWAAYPHRVDRLALFGPAPAGEVRVEARLVCMRDDRRPQLRVQAIDLQRGAVWAELDLTEILMPKGPIGIAAPDARVAFLRDRRFVPNLALSTVERDRTVARAADVKASDWLPGTVAAVYRADEDLLGAVAVGDHVARAAHVHPGTVTASEGAAVSAAMPLTVWPIAIERSADAVAVRSTGAPTFDLDPVRRFWADWFGIGRWPVEDIYYGLMQRFVRRVHVTDPDSFAKLRGRSAVYLGNHQVGVESLMFSILASALNGVSTVTLAKAEHRTTWLGRLIAHCFAYPGVQDPQVIEFFDRDNKRSLPGIIQQLAAAMSGPGKSVMVHVEGTRSLTCREPVQIMSGAFLDMATSVGAPVVPIRFAGALPVAPLTERLEFPVGMGVQDLWLGPVLWPEDLLAVTYKERKEMALRAINATGPSHAIEEPFPGDPVFAAKVAERVARTGVDEPHAVILEVLAELAERTSLIQRVLDGDRAGMLRLGVGPHEEWLGELARRLYGPRGARVDG